MYKLQQNKIKCVIMYLHLTCLVQNRTEQLARFCLSDAISIVWFRDNTLKAEI